MGYEKRSGDLAAHLDICLMLLSSLPDMVHNTKSRKTRFKIYYILFL